MKCWLWCQFNLLHALVIAYQYKGQTELMLVLLYFFYHLFSSMFPVRDVECCRNELLPLWRWSIRRKHFCSYTTGHSLSECGTSGSERWWSCTGEQPDESGRYPAVKKPARTLHPVLWSTKLSTLSLKQEESKDWTKKAFQTNVNQYDFLFPKKIYSLSLGKTYSFWLVKYSSCPAISTDTELFRTESAKQNRALQWINCTFKTNYKYIYSSAYLHMARLSENLHW